MGERQNRRSMIASCEPTKQVTNPPKISTCLPSISRRKKQNREKDHLHPFRAILQEHFISNMNSQLFIVADD